MKRILLILMGFFVITISVYASDEDAGGSSATQGYTYQFDDRGLIGFQIYLRPSSGLSGPLSLTNYVITANSQSITVTIDTNESSITTNDPTSPTKLKSVINTSPQTFTCTVTSSTPGYISFLNSVNFFVVSGRGMQVIYNNGVCTGFYSF